MNVRQHARYRSIIGHHQGQRNHRRESKGPRIQSSGEGTCQQIRCTAQIHVPCRASRVSIRQTATNISCSMHACSPRAQVSPARVQNVERYRVLSCFSFGHQLSLVELRARWLRLCENLPGAWARFRDLSVIPDRCGLKTRSLTDLEHRAAPHTSTSERVPARPSCASIYEAVCWRS